MLGMVFYRVFLCILGRGRYFVLFIMFIIFLYLEVLRFGNKFCGGNNYLRLYFVYSFVGFLLEGEEVCLLFFF